MSLLQVALLAVVATGYAMAVGGYASGYGSGSSGGSYGATKFGSSSSSSSYAAGAATYGGNFGAGNNQGEAAPKPYNFDYQSQDEEGNTHYRNEEGDASGTVRGTYGYTDNQGLFRVVEYIADANGFRANIRTNEPGTDGKESPADVRMTVDQPPAGIQERYSGFSAAGSYGAGRGVALGAGVGTGSGAGLGNYGSAAQSGYGSGAGRPAESGTGLNRRVQGGRRGIGATAGSQGPAKSSY